LPKKLPTRNPVYRTLWTLDSYVSSGVFETWDFLKRAGSAYSSFLCRFRLSGPKRLVADVADDFATFGVVAAFALMAYALPPFSGTDDVWNRGRDYAITFTDQQGDVIGQRGIRQDDAIPLEELSPHLIKAVLATEDARFFDHFGVDLIGTLRAIVQNARASGVRQGGSSITQQVAKNLFLSPERTVRRKVHEAFLSMWIEARLSKQEILKLYLDRSYLGGGNYGVEAAAQFYFGKSARDVTVSEAAMIAGLFKAPTNYAPHQNIEAARARANVVLYRMLDAGFLTQGELLQARRAPAQVAAQDKTDSPDWFLDWAYRDTLDLLETQRITGDYVLEVKTTIDRKLQTEAQKIINEAIDAEGPPNHFTQASAVTMAPDGAVKAIVGGRNYADSQFNRATDAKRQSGSSFKPFVYLTALLAGYKPTDIVVDGPVAVGNWAPKNYSGGYAGRTTLQNALAHSYNSIPVKLLLDVGRDNIAKTAHEVGISGELDTWPTMVLGTSALTLLDLTNGYATFAAGGKRSRPYAVLEVRRPNGDLLYSRSANGVENPQVVPVETVADLNQMLSAVVKAGTARRADLGFAPQGGKTGTNQSYRDAWYVGFTAHNVTGVWVGNDDFTPMNKVTGGLIPAPIWKRIMLVAEAGTVPEAVAGIPLDGSYTRVAVAGPAEAAAAGSADSAEIAAAEGQPGTDESADVLNGMFGLFEANAPKQVGKPKTVKTAKTLVLPKANTDRQKKKSFLESLFGSKDQPTKKKKKKKTLFNF
jgi:penicillin-binding protein 1A